MDKSLPAAAHLFDPPAGPAKPGPLIRAAMETGAFGSTEAARQYLTLIWFPPSRAWRYQLNGKSGNTFVLNLLFELEYGVPFSCHFAAEETGNQHPDLALFNWPTSGLLSHSLAQGDRFAAFTGFPGLSLATVRDPYDRALSGFRYLCRSHRLGDRRFLAERLRLNALVGFDWALDIDRTAGFAKFVTYLTEMAQAHGAERLDPHWRPQALHIRPDLYGPDLIGRTDRLDRFATELARRLDRPLPRALSDLRRNASDRGPSDPLADAYAQPGLRAKVADLYGDDFALVEAAL